MRIPLSKYPNQCRYNETKRGLQVCPPGYECDLGENICYSREQFKQWLQNADVWNAFVAFYKMLGQNAESNLTPSGMIKFLTLGGKHPDLIANPDFFQLAEKGIGFPNDFEVTRSLKDLQEKKSYPKKFSPGNVRYDYLTQPIPSFYSKKEISGNRVWENFTPDQRQLYYGLVMSQNDIERMKRQKNIHVGKKRGGEVLENPLQKLPK